MIVLDKEIMMEILILMMIRNLSAKEMLVLMLPKLPILQKCS
jgi:hypothetical protein